MNDSRFNGKMLVVARKSRGMSQSALASYFSGNTLAQGTLSKFESELLTPADDVVEKLASILDYPASFFYQPDRLYGLPLSVHPAPMFRKRKTLPVKEVDRAIAVESLLIFHLRRLLETVDLGEGLPLPKWDLDDFGSSPEKIADAVRRTWLIPPGPIQNLVELVEQAGIIVVITDYDGAGVDGLTVSPPGLPPIIMLQKNASADRRRFSLAHELGHLVMHDAPSSTMEQEANNFASALLMPANDILPDLRGRPDLARLGKLKQKWGVAMQAIMMRAASLGVISPVEKTNFFKLMSKKGYRKEEPSAFDIPYETPSTLSRLFKVQLDELGYSVEELAATLHINEKDLASRYGVAKGSDTGKKTVLRLVK